MINCVDVISLTCAILSLASSVIIGVLQIRQDRRVNHLSVEQMKKEQKRYSESVNMEVRRFLSEYHEIIGLLPLCAIAMVYDENYPYSRKMYSDFRLLPKDVQTALFEKCGWSMCNVKSYSFYSECLSKLELRVKTTIPKSKFSLLFYDNGKYFENSIKVYGKEDIPDSDWELQSKIFDIIYSAKRANPNNPSEMFQEIISKTEFASCEGIIASQIACYTVSSLAEQLRLESPAPDSEEFYGCPGGWDGERIETMEDLFLFALFEIWSNLWDANDNQGKGA